jgi:hypothetical protein
VGMMLSNSSYNAYDVKRKKRKKKEEEEKKKKREIDTNGNFK